MKTYCIVYRTGGTENFKWRRTLPMSRENATQAHASVERMGYPALMVDYELSKAVGLPETFSAHDKWYTEAA